VGLFSYVGIFIVWLVLVWKVGVYGKDVVFSGGKLFVFV